MTASVGHTCPTIDTIILELKDLYLSLYHIRDAGTVSSEVLDSLLQVVEEMYRGDESKLERLRDSNAKLRAWAEDTERKCGKWHDQYHEAKERADHLEKQVRILEQQLMEF